MTGDKEMKFVLPTGWSSKETASEIASRLLDEGIDVKGEAVRVAATGYGRVAVDYADFVITEITYLHVETDYSQSDVGQLNTRIAALIEML